MALGDNYIEMDELKDYLGIKPGKIDNNEVLTNACASASREVERICNRQFNKTDSASARIYTASNRCGTLTHTDDFYDLAGLVVEYRDVRTNSSWLTIPDTDYEVSPLNGMVDGIPGWPYNKIELVNGWYMGIYGRYLRFRVTAKWGWESIPADVRQACFMLAGDTYQQKDSPYGVMADQYGVTLRPSGPTSGVGTQARLRLSRYARNRIQVA